MIGMVIGVAAAYYWHAQEPLREAQAAYCKGDFPLALRWSRWLLTHRPYHQSALRLVGRCCARLHDYEQARQVFLKIPRLEAEDSLLLGLCLARSGAYARAAELLQESLSGRPTAEGRRILAVVYRELSQSNLAIKQASRIVDDPIEGDQALMLLAELYLADRRSREAYEATQRLHRRHPRRTDLPDGGAGLLRLQIACLLQLGEPDRAAELLSELGDISADARALELRGQLHRTRGNLDRAEQDWRDALAIDPQRADVLIQLAVLLTEEQREAEALVWLRQALQLLPESPIVHRQLGVVYRQLDKKRSAESRQQSTPELTDN